LERGSLRDWRAHLALWLPAAIWFAPQLLFGRVGYFRDTGLYFQPHKALIAEALRAGRLPEWNPFEYGGMPLLADPNFNTFHPLSLLADLLPLPWGFGVFSFACALFAAYGGRALGRALGLGHAGALAAGLFFAWSGPTVSFLLSGQMVASCFLPWLCAAGANLGSKRSLKALLLCAVAAALQLVSGTPEIGACAFALGGILAISEARGAGAASTVTRAIRSARVLKAAAQFLLASMLGAALSAIQLFPSVEFLRASSRASGFSVSAGLAFSLAPLRLPELLLPFFSGDIDSPGVSSWIFADDAQPYLQQIYLGLLVAVLALSGLRAAGARRRLPLLAFALFCTVLALGKHLSPVAQLWQLFPPLRIVRFPEKLIVPLSLAAAVSAGAGWERLSAWLRAARVGRPGLLPPIAAGGLTMVALFASASSLWLQRLASAWPEARRLSLQSTLLPSLALESALGAVALLLIALASREKIAASFARGGIAALLIAELASPALKLDRTAPATDWTGAPVLTRLLVADARAPAPRFRISSQSTGMPTSMLDAIAAEEDTSRSLALFRVRRAMLFDASVVRDGLRSDRGYSGFTPGGLQRLYTRANDGAALDLLQVRYAIEYGSGPSTYLALGFRPRPDLTGAAIAAMPSLAMARLRVFENPQELRAAWLSPAVLTSSEPVAPRCAGKLVPWLDEADLRSLPPGLPRGEACAAIDAYTAKEVGTATISAFEPERLRLHVDAKALSVLVLAESATPGWRAFVDDAETPVLSADGALRACAIPAGPHEVSFVYAQPGLRAGAMISGFCLLLLAALSVLSTRRSPRAS
jgi:hypothetical protein